MKFYPYLLVAGLCMVLAPTAAQGGDYKGDFRGISEKDPFLGDKAIDILETMISEVLAEIGKSSDLFEQKDMSANDVESQWNTLFGNALTKWDDGWGRATTAARAINNEGGDWKMPPSWQAWGTANRNFLVELQTEGVKMLQAYCRAQRLIMQMQTDRKNHAQRVLELHKGMEFIQREMDKADAISTDCYNKKIDAAKAKNDILLFRPHVEAQATANRIVVQFAKEKIEKFLSETNNSPDSIHKEYQTLLADWAAKSKTKIEKGVESFIATIPEVWDVAYTEMWADAYKEAYDAYKNDKNIRDLISGNIGDGYEKFENMTYSELDARIKEYYEGFLGD